MAVELQMIFNVCTDLVSHKAGLNTGNMRETIGSIGRTEIKITESKWLLDGNPLKFSTEKL